MRDGMGRVRCGLLCLALAAIGCSKKDAPAEGAKDAPQAAQDAPEGAEGAPEKGTPAAEADTPAAATPKAPAGTPPTILATLSAEHTMAVSGIEGLDGMARALADLMGALPDELKAEMQEKLPRGFDSIVERMGFDPRVAEAWGTVGLDAAAGVSVVLDARLVSEAGQPWPVLMARVSDRGKLVAALDRIDPAFEVGLPETDGIAAVTTPDGEALLGQRGDFTAVLIAPQGADDAKAAARAAFAGWLKASDGPLSKAEALAPATHLAPGSRLYSITLIGPLAARLAGEAEQVFARFYGARFPAVSISIGADMKSGGMRLLADEAGVAALRQVLVPDHAAPDLDRFAPANSVTAGFSIDPVSMFDGVVALIPPERGDLQGQVLIGKNAIPVATGVSLDDLGKALSGHMVLSVSLAGLKAGGAPPVVTAIGVGDTAVLDRVLPILLDKLVAQTGGTRAPTKFGALEGHVVEQGGSPAFVVRSGDALLIGQSRDGIEAALAREKAPEGGPQVDFADGAFYTVSIAAAALDAAMAEMPPEAAPAAAAARDFWRSRFGEGMSIATRLDDHGVRSDGVGAAALIGIGTAVAIPAFMKYIRRSKSAQARLMLSQLFSKVTVARLEGKPLTAAPLTPALDPCADGRDGSYVSTPEMWRHPTWQALGFAPTGEQHYRYAVEPGEGQGFTVRAVGDLNCDGVLAEFASSADAEGRRQPEMVRNPLE